MESTTLDEMSWKERRSPRPRSAAESLDASARALLAEIRFMEQHRVETFRQELRRMEQRLTAVIEGRRDALNDCQDQRARVVNLHLQGRPAYASSADAPTHPSMPMFDDEAIYDQYNDDIDEPFSPTLPNPSTVATAGSAAASGVAGYIDSGSTPTTLIAAAAADFIPGDDTPVYDIYNDDFLGADTPKTFGASSAAMLDSSVNSSPTYDQNTVDASDAKASTKEMVAAGVGNVGGSDHGLASTHAATAATTTVSASSVTSSDMPTTCSMEVPNVINNLTKPTLLHHVAGEFYLYPFDAAATSSTIHTVLSIIVDNTPTKCSLIDLAGEFMQHGASNIRAQMSLSARGITFIFCPAKRPYHAVVLWKQERNFVDWQPRPFPWPSFCYYEASEHVRCAAGILLPATFRKLLWLWKPPWPNFPQQLGRGTALNLLDHALICPILWPNIIASAASDDGFMDSVLLSKMISSQHLKNYFKLLGSSVVGHGRWLWDPGIYFFQCQLVAKGEGLDYQGPAGRVSNAIDSVKSDFIPTDTLDLWLAISCSLYGMRNV